MKKPKKIGLEFEIDKKMKAKKLDLDIDVIGGEGPLTIAEEKALSDFFKQRKLMNVIKNKKMKRTKSSKVNKDSLATV